MKKIIFFSLVILICGCYHTQKVSREFVVLLDTKKTQNLRLVNKVFQSNYDTHYPYIIKRYLHSDTIYKPYLEHPIYFFEGNIIFFDNGSITGEESQIGRVLKEPKQFYNDDGWGVFEVKGDTIMAKIFNYFWGKGSIGNTNSRFECNYMGILKNNDTILNWRMIPPYPSINMKFTDNILLLESLKLGRNKYFKEVTFLSNIDPSKAWIDKYKTK
jgi:hypothetical protein